MKKIKQITITVVLFTLLMGLGKQSEGQVFFIGINGGVAYSWFNSPGIDNLITSDGWGHNLGFFLRYGKRPYFQFGFDWTRTKNEIDLNITDAPDYRENIPFHIFDFSFKVGYEILQLPMFKIKAQAGPFIGRSLLLSTDDFIIEKDEFKRPQYGVIAGFGFQFTNLIVDFEYTYHISDLFKPFEFSGQTYKLHSNLQLISLKVGFMF